MWHLVLKPDVKSWKEVARTGLKRKWIFSQSSLVFWPVKKIGKKWTNPCVILYQWTWLHFYKETKTKIYRWGFGHCSRIRVCETSQHDQWVDIVHWLAIILIPTRRTWNVCQVQWDELKWGQNVVLPTLTPCWPTPYSTSILYVVYKVHCKG